MRTPRGERPVPTRTRPLPRTRSTVVDLVRALTARAFLVPVLVLATGSAAIGTMTGLLPALAGGLGAPLAVSVAAVAVLAVVSSLLQPWAGRWTDSGRLPVGSAGVGGAVAVAVGFLALGVVPSVVTFFVAAVLVVGLVV